MGYPNASSSLTGEFHRERTLTALLPVFWKLLPWQPLAKLHQSHHTAGVLSAVTSLSVKLIYSDNGADGGRGSEYGRVRVPQDGSPTPHLPFMFRSSN